MIDQKRLIAGALSGFVAAVLVDIHAWSSAGDVAFDWTKALKRWVAGAVSGALTAIGFGGATPA